MSPVLGMDSSAAARRINVAVKASLFVAFAIALTVPLDSLDGKAMGARAPLFLASAVLVPIVGRRRGWSPHAHIGDALLAAPFLLDTLGNLFGIYDSFEQTDDLLHAFNWVLLVAAFHAFRFRNVEDRRDALLLGYGFGAITIVWWEILEWVASEDGLGGAGGLALTYGDTIGDLLMSTTGGLIGSWLGVRYFAAGRPPRRAAVWGVSRPRETGGGDSSG
jgi:hypothetical protein